MHTPFFPIFSSAQHSFTIIFFPLYNVLSNFFLLIDAASLIFLLLYDLNNSLSVIYSNEIYKSAFEFYINLLKSPIYVISFVTYYIDLLS